MQKYITRHRWYKTKETKSSKQDRAKSQWHKYRGLKIVTGTQGQSRMFIRHQKSKNSLTNTQNFLAEFCLFCEWVCPSIIILLLLYSILQLLQFLMKTLLEPSFFSHFCKYLHDLHEKNQSQNFTLLHLVFPSRFLPVEILSSWPCVVAWQPNLW